MMHHHLVEGAGHFDGLLALRMQCRARRTIVQTKSFHLSPWSTLSAGYSAHTKPAAAMVICCDAKNEAKKNSSVDAVVSKGHGRSEDKLHGWPMHTSCQAWAELEFIAGWAQKPAEKIKPL